MLFELMLRPWKKTTYIRAIRYTPATTIVAAWMSEETGVGPDVASGSQWCRGNWPDFEVTPQKRARAPISRSVWLIAPEMATSLMWKTLKLVAPAAKKVRMTPMMRPVSPTRLVRNALSAALVLA